MSVKCGNCGDIIFVSKNKDWTTRKDRPEMSCDNRECVNHTWRVF